MLIKNKSEVKVVEWGNGQSYRLVTADDKMGFTVCHTVVTAGSQSKLQYRSHLEACYCIAGKGEILTATGESHPIEPGTLYALDQYDPHTLVAGESEDMHLVSVFNPPLTGDERHQLSADGYSQY